MRRSRHSWKVATRREYPFLSPREFWRGYRYEILFESCRYPRLFVSRVSVGYRHACTIPPVSVDWHACPHYCRKENGGGKTLRTVKKYFYSHRLHGAFSSTEHPPHFLSYNSFAQTQTNRRKQRTLKSYCKGLSLNSRQSFYSKDRNSGNRQRKENYKDMFRVYTFAISQHRSFDVEHLLDDRAR